MPNDNLPAAALDEDKPRRFRVLVPVILAIEIEEEDDLAAEVLAQDIADSIAWGEVAVGDLKARVRVESLLKTTAEVIADK